MKKLFNHAKKQALDWEDNEKCYEEELSEGYEKEAEAGIEEMEGYYAEEPEFEVSEEEPEGYYAEEEEFEGYIEEAQGYYLEEPEYESGEEEAQGYYEEEAEYEGGVVEIEGCYAEEAEYEGSIEEAEGCYGEKAEYEGSEEEIEEYKVEEEEFEGSVEEIEEYYEEEAEYEGSAGQAEGYYEERAGFEGYIGEGEGYNAEEAEYEGSVEEADGYYVEEAEFEGSEEETEGYYAEETEYEGSTGEADGYYVEEAEYEGSTGEADGYYVEEAGGYYEEKADFEGYIGQGEGYYAEETEYEGSMEESGEYFDSEEQADVYEAARIRKNINKNKKRPPQRNRFNVIVDSIRNMAAMDMVMVAAGICALVLVAVVGRAFFQKRVVEAQVADFASVGTELNGISIIGEKGLSAVAQAEMERIAASVVKVEENPVEEPTEDNKKDYEEAGYQRQVSVKPDFTSIQKDLKIKFINQNTNKLVANVPFSVTVTAPDGKTYIWSDDDMDGIIYKKDILSGNYQVAMESLTDSKYSGYNIPTAAKTVEVKEKIAYEKVDVVNEVKKETEINAAKEDTKKNEMVVESVLQDTVAWVESKVIGATYNEVLKSSIPDPALLASIGNLVRLSQTENPVTGPSSDPTEESTSEPVSEPTPDTASAPGPDTTSESTAEPAPETTPEPGSTSPATPEATPTAAPTATPEATPTAAPTATPEATPTAAPTATPEATSTAAPTGTPTAAPTAVPTATPTAVPMFTPTPSASPIPAKGTISVDNTLLKGAVNAVLMAKASAAGFAEGSVVVYAIQSGNPSVASASIDGNGNISVIGVAEGTAVITVTANYVNGAAETAATASINVTIANMAMTLDKSAVTVFTQVPLVINASIANAAVQDLAVTAQSSDTNVATVSVDKKSVSILGVSEGSAVITVSYMENQVTVSEECTVTVKKHPSEDNVTPLKTSDGQQLYVLDNNDYREATYADYYTAEKFFVKGGIKYTGWQTIGGKVYYFTADSNIITGEHVIQGAKYTFASDGSLVTGNGVLGIDVSKWNGSIDWNAVKNSGISYVIIRCGYRGSQEGKLIEDPKFESNIKGATAAGLKVGVYFFTQAVDEIEAVEEASMVLALIKNYTISYPVFIDVESSGGRGDKIDSATRTAVCKAFCQTIQSEGYTAGVYSNKLWLEGRIDMQSLNAYKVWLAQYVASPTYTGRYDLWQYKSTGSVSGISGNVDLNISYLGY